MKKIIGLTLLSLISVNSAFAADEYSAIKKEIETRALEALLLNSDKVGISNLGDLNGLAQEDAAAFADYKGKALSYILASEITQDTIPCPAQSAVTAECVRRSSFSSSCYPQDVEAVGEAKLAAEKKKLKEVALVFQCNLIKLTVETKEDFLNATSSKKSIQVLKKEEGQRHGEYLVDVTVKTDDLTRDAVSSLKLKDNAIRIGFKKSKN